MLKGKGVEQKNLEWKRREDAVGVGGWRETTDFNRPAPKEGTSGPRPATRRAETGLGQTDSRAVPLYSRMEEARPVGRDPWEQAAALHERPQAREPPPRVEAPQTKCLSAGRPAHGVEKKMSKLRVARPRLRPRP